jgi:hypothetical protein
MEKQLWLEKLENEFDKQTRKDVYDLIIECLTVVKGSKLALKIAKNIIIENRITFNQWKTLRVLLVEKRNPHKTL